MKKPRIFRVQLEIHVAHEGWSRWVGHEHRNAFIGRGHGWGFDVDELRSGNVGKVPEGAEHLEDDPLLVGHLCGSRPEFPTLFGDIDYH